MLHPTFSLFGLLLENYQGVDAILKYGSTLTVLSIRNCVQITDHGITSILQGLKNLSIFTLSGSFSSPDTLTKTWDHPILYEKRSHKERGSPASNQYFLGMHYYNNSQYGPKDLKKAVEHFQNAANLGHKDAESNIAFCYANGIGVPKDLKKAVLYFQKAANQGCTGSACDLGFCFKSGTDILGDLEKAVNYHAEAVQKEEINSKSQLFFPIKNVSLQDCSQIVTDEIVEQVAKHCVPQDLNLRMCSNITDR